MKCPSLILCSSSESEPASTRRIDISHLKKFSFTKIPCSALKPRHMGKIFLLKLSNRHRHQKVVEAAGFQLFNIDISNSNFQGKPGKKPGFLFLTAHLKSPLCVVIDMSNTMIEQDLVERLNHRIVIFEPVRVKR